jgi:NADH-quinone oxidoreductase subunit N
VGIGMAVFMLSLAGIPPTAGFMGKYFIFYEAISAGGRYTTLGIIGIATSIVGAYYYLRVIAYTYFRDPDDRPVAGKEDWGLKFALSLTVLGTVFLGIFPQGFYDAAKESVENLQGETQQADTSAEGK